MGSVSDLIIDNTPTCDNCFVEFNMSEAVRDSDGCLYCPNCNNIVGYE